MNAPINTYQLLFVLFLSLVTSVKAACTTELILASVFGGLWALFLIVLLLYCCIKRCCRARRRQDKLAIKSAEEGYRSGVWGLEMSSRVSEDMSDGQGKRHLCAQCNQRIARVKTDMPVIASLENTGMSTSEEGLTINGSALVAGRATSAPLDEARVFVFVEKNANEGLGLYLVPFEEEPLTGLFVKTIVPGKSAARLAVFDPGDKIVTVNGKSLNGLSYRESTDFIRHCPGPNVKMGIIKHALHTKEDLEKLQTMAVYQRQSGAEFLAQGPNVGVGGAVGVDIHPARLSGSVPDKDLHGNIGGGIGFEEPAIQKSGAGLNLESTPDFLGGGGSMEIDASGPDGSFPGFDIGDGLKTGVDTNANLEGQVEMPGVGLEGKDIDVKPGGLGAFGGISVPKGSAETRKLRRVAKGCRRSRSNPQLRSRRAADSPPPPQSVQHSSTTTTGGNRGRVYSFDHINDYDVGLNVTTPMFRVGNPCAKAGPLVEPRSEPRNFPRSYIAPLSDSPSVAGSSRILKTRSLDKLNEIMRNDPILCDDYAESPSSKSTQTQTDTQYARRKKPRRKRNDRPRSQILPPTFLQLPSVTWLPGELGTPPSQAPLGEPIETETDYPWRPHYPQGIHRRRSKEEQAQIVQRWIEEMIEHKRSQQLQKTATKEPVNREKSTKLKKKSRSVPEHAFRGKMPKREHARPAAHSDDLWKRPTQTGYPKLRHFDSDPNFESDLSRRVYGEKLSVNTVSVGTSTSGGASPLLGDRLSPSLQSRIRSLEQSFKENNQSASNVQTSPYDDPMAGLSRQNRRVRVSNPDLPLISHLLSSNELDSSHC